MKSSGILLSKLHNSNFDAISSMQLLEEIASEHSFDVTYVHIEERSKSGIQSYYFVLG